MLGKNVRVNFIGTQTDVALLEALKGKPYIGMDGEWRPIIKPFALERLAIF